MVDSSVARISSAILSKGLESKGMSRSFPLERVRNIGIIAHIDAGKTTVTERVLFVTGRTYKIGEVDEGTAVMDWMDQEKERGITITAAATTSHWREHRFNIIDTPGHVDFTAEVERSLRVLDGGVVVFDAVAGVEAQSETVWHQADKYAVPRICFVNKMDRVGANLRHTLSMMYGRLNAKAILTQLPLGTESEFKGIMDVIGNEVCFPSDDNLLKEVRSAVPAAYQKEVSLLRQSLIETVAEVDDPLASAYLSDSTLTPEEIKAALRRATVANKVVPVLCGSALKGIGLQCLLDAIVDYLPSPQDVPPVRGTNPKTGEPVVCPPVDDAPFAALAFKIVADPFMGRLVYFRVYSGQVNTGAQVLNSTRGQKERFGRLLLMHANRREEVTEANTGDILATVGLKNTFTGDTLCAIHRPIVLEPIRFPVPVLSVAIEPRTKVDQERMVNATAKLAEEDPTFVVRYDQDTGETILSGMGELHLEVLVERMRREFKMEARVGKPQVAYRETITEPVKVEGRFIKQVGGRGQYGDVWLALEPLERGAGFQFVDALKGGVIPREFIPAVAKGIKEALGVGVAAGYPVVDVRVSLYDGSYHEVDSSEIAFKMAGFIGFQEGCRRAKPVLLEPIMKVEVVGPGEFLGDLISDLTSRRGHIEATEMRGDTCVITALAPLSEMFGYATIIRSLSQGRATYSMEFHSYREVPPEQAMHILPRAKVA